MKKRLAITVIILAALIGLSGCTDQHESDTHGSDAYYIMVENDTVINGKEQLQGFFDDYMNDRPCTLDIFEVEEVRDGKYIGTSNVLNISEEQGCIYYQITANEGKYTAYENAEYSDKKTLITKSNPEHMAEPYFALFDGIDYICFTSHDAPYRAEFNMDFLQNSYENFEKLYDVTRAKTAVIQDGKVVGGEDAFYDFVRTYFKWEYGFIHIAGDNDIIIGKYDYHNTLSIVDGEVSTELELTVIPLWEEQEVYLSLYFNGDHKYILHSMTFDKAYEEGIFFSGQYTSPGSPGYFFEELDATERVEKIDELVTLLNRDINSSSLTEQKPKAKVYSAYISGCEAMVHFYKNEDGVSDTVGVLYPGADSNNETLRYYKVSEELRSLLNEGLNS